MGELTKSDSTLEAYCEEQFKLPGNQLQNFVHTDAFNLLDFEPPTIPVVIGIATCLLYLDRNLVVFFGVSVNNEGDFGMGAALKLNQMIQ